MKILGRSPRRIVSVFWQLPIHFIASYRCFVLFRRLGEILRSYIRRQNPPRQKVEFRDGLVINLSKDNSDIVTVFLIFCRHDYGKITPGSVVVDIGANIGVFSLYAAREGAKIVQAYEPAEESFDFLQKNIEENGFGKIIFPHRAAVVGKSSPPVWFPRQSNVFNAIKINSENTADNYTVLTVTFAALVNNISEPKPIMFKLDCEGGEYDIILNSEDSVFDRIEEIRLEYHRGPRQQLFSRFEKLGFHRRQFMDSGEGGGYLWLTRPTSKVTAKST
jgi:FkbM family methyltransferase